MTTFGAASDKNFIKMKTLPVCIIRVYADQNPEGHMASTGHNALTDKIDFFVLCDLEFLMDDLEKQ